MLTPESVESLVKIKAEETRREIFNFIDSAIIREFSNNFPEMSSERIIIIRPETFGRNLFDAVLDEYKKIGWKIEEVSGSPRPTYYFYNPKR